MMESREPRYKVEIRVDCATRDLFTANRITNISRGGIFIETQLPIQAEVDLKLTLPDTRVTIGARGRVVWNYDMRQGSTALVAGSGIKFTDIDPEDRALLDSYLSKLTTTRAPTRAVAAC